MKPKCLLLVVWFGSLALASPALAAPLRVAVLGDSLSDDVFQPQNWVDQLGTTGNFTMTDVALAGATSDSVISGGQDTAVASMAGSLDYAVLIIGTNDIADNLSTVIAGGAGEAAVVNNLVSNVEYVAGELAAAGVPHVVLGTAADITVTPLIQSEVPNPSDQAAIQAALQAANAQIVSYAAAHQIPVMDTYAASQALRSPIALGGVTLQYPGQVFEPDNFHPNTAVHGIIANMFIQSLDASHLANVPLISDQQILTTAGISHSPGTSYYDVSSFVIPVPEPSTAVLGTLGLVSLAATALRRPFGGRGGPTWLTTACSRRRPRTSRR